MRFPIVFLGLFSFIAGNALASTCYVPALESVSDLTNKYPYIFKGRVRYIENSGLGEDAGNRIAVFDPIKIYKGQTNSKYNVEYSFNPAEEDTHNSEHRHYVTDKEYLIFAHRNQNNNLKTPPYCSYARHHNVSFNQLDEYFDTGIDSPIKHEVCVERIVNYAKGLRAARNDTFGELEYERHCYSAPENRFPREIFTGNFEPHIP